MRLGMQQQQSIDATQGSRGLDEKPPSPFEQVKRAPLPQGEIVIAWLNLEVGRKRNSKRGLTQTVSHFPNPPRPGTPPPQGGTAICLGEPLKVSRSDYLDSGQATILEARWFFLRSWYGTTYTTVRDLS